MRHQQPRKRIDLIRQVQVVTRTLQKWKHCQLYRERTSERVLLLLKENVITTEAVVCATTIARAENFKSFDRFDYYWNIAQHEAPVIWPNTVMLYLCVINCSADSLVMVMSIRRVVGRKNRILCWRVSLKRFGWIEDRGRGNRGGGGTQPPPGATTAVRFYIAIKHYIKGSLNLSTICSEYYSIYKRATMRKLSNY